MAATLSWECYCMDEKECFWSLPMLCRKAQSKETKLYGASVMGVGVGAMAFHASSGKLRHWGRKLDYWVSTQFKQTCYPCQQFQPQMTQGPSNWRCPFTCSVVMPLG